MKFVYALVQPIISAAAQATFVFVTVVEIEPLLPF